MKQTLTVDPVFRALSDPTRRKLIELLAEGERAVLDLVQRFNISQPAISQHLRLLLQSGLVIKRKHGRHRLYSLQPEALKMAYDWLGHYESFWNDRLDRLALYLDDAP